MRVLACIAQKEDECLSQIIMNGGNDVLEHIDKRRMNLKILMLIQL